MRRKTGNCPQPRTSLTLILEPDELRVLDSVASGLELDRKDALMRGLFLLDTAGLLMFAPSDATIAVGIGPRPSDGSRFGLAVG